MELGANTIDQIRALHKTIINSSTELVGGARGRAGAVHQRQGAGLWEAVLSCIPERQILN